MLTVRRAQHWCPCSTQCSDVTSLFNRGDRCWWHLVSLWRETHSPAAPSDTCFCRSWRHLRRNTSRQRRPVQRGAPGSLAHPNNAARAVRADVVVTFGATVRLSESSATWPDLRDLEATIRSRRKYNHYMAYTAVEQGGHSVQHFVC
jgi:hypothetical protein